MSAEHLDDLRTKAKYARERYQLYRAKAYGQQPTSAARLRELQRDCEQAEARLSFASAEAQRPQSASGSDADGSRGPAA